MLRSILFLCISSLCMAQVGCVGKVLGGMMQNEEYQKLIEVLPKYDDLAGHTTAVLVDVDMGVLYDHPGLDEILSRQVAMRVQQEVEGVRVVNPVDISRWKYQTPQWYALPYGDLPKMLNVDRIILIDVLEYRLNPPGNRYQWEGIAVAEVGVLERDSLDPDMVAETFTIAAEFPNTSEVTIDEASRDRIELGLLAEFIKRTGWLFYRHTEPKYPDKYRPHLDPDRDPRGAIRTEEKDGVQ